jgi:hypothetical protein
MTRLEDQIRWYDAKSRSCQIKFKLLKGLEIFSAVAITLAGSSEMKGHITAYLGALVLVVEAIEHLNQYQQNWISYRSTCEALKHEKYLFLAVAGPYSTAAEPIKLLAERVEALISREHAKWVSEQEDATKTKSRGKLPPGT